MPTRLFDSRTAVLDAALDAIITIDADGRVMEFNAAAERTFGFSRDVACGRLLADLIIPSRYRQAHFDGLRRYIQTGEAHVLGRRIQLAALRADGSEFPVELAITRVPDLDPPVFTGFVRDLTEQRLAERRRAGQYRVATILADAESLEAAASPLLQTLLDVFDMAVSGFWIVDGEFLRCVATAHGSPIVDESFEEGCRSIVFVRGVGLPGRIWESGSAHWIGNVQEEDNFSRAAAAARQGLRGAFGFPAVIGGTVAAVFEFFSMQVLQRDNDLAQLFESVGHQVAQFLARKRAEADRAQALTQEQRARRDAEAADRAKDDFIAVVSHEMRTPLNAILGWTTMLKSGILNDEKRARAMDAIEESARAQAQLIEDLLDMSRIARRSLTISSGPTDVAAVVRAAVAMVQPLAQERGVSIRTVGWDQAVSMWADRARLQQVVWNLVSNAVKFTPQGGWVTVSLVRRDRLLDIIVTDTGIGIRQEFLPYLFEPFRQGDTGRTRGGLGLGLAIVRHLVELHGGAVRVVSEGEGKGSTFTVTLPVDRRGA